MEIKAYRTISMLFALLFVFTTSSVTAGDDIESINAGEDQAVMSGDTVQLSGSIVLEDDDHKHGHKDRKHEKHKKHSKRGKHDRHDKGERHNDFRHAHYSEHHKHKKHSRDDDDEDIRIAWEQVSGIPVDLIAADTLAPSFVAPEIVGVDEILEFSLNVFDDDGDLLASDTVLVTVKAPVIPTSAISGRITAVDGTALTGVSIDVLSGGASLSNLVSGTNGHFSLELEASSDVVLHLSADGYADQVVPARSPDTDGHIFLAITMIARGGVQSFNADSAATLTGDDGASVSVQAGSFVDANGLPVTGVIDLSITPVDVSRPASLAAFPGEFSGVLEGDTMDSPIVSLGTVEFEFSQNGQPLQLAPGTSAEVMIPIYIATYQDGSPINPGDSIPLWSLNEATGLWQQEGFGSVVASTESPTGLAMLATVTHFSWWNCDVSMNAAQAIVTVYGPDSGTALIKARTNADIGWRPNTVETVASVGTPTTPLYIPSNGEVCFWAEINFDNGSNGTTPEVCVTAAPSSLITVDLFAPVAGPINIVTRPAATAGILDVDAYQGYPARRVQLQPSTYETAVAYSIVSGALPPGLSLNPVNATSAEIAGVPTGTGVFSVVVQATDSDGFTDTVTINFTVTTDVPPPELEAFIDISYIDVPASFDLNTYNLAGPATNWVLSENIISENGPPPAGVSLDPATGILTISDWCIFWQGDVTASNASGSSTASIYIENWGCW